MQKNTFKCYYCNIENSYIVPQDTKGKECRCCLAYNYFFDNKNSKNKNKICNKKCNKKRKIYISNINYNKNKNLTNREEFDYNNKFYYKEFCSNNKIHSNNELNISINNINNRRIQNQLSSLKRLINRILRDGNLINIKNNIRENNSNILFNISNERNIDNKKEEEKDENNLVKYTWLKKEKLSQNIIDKSKDGYECSICLEMIKLKEDISILKCKHIFHYKCIEKYLDHQFTYCPNCRCELKTGDKQPINQNNNFNLFINNVISYDNLDLEF